MSSRNYLKHSVSTTQPPTSGNLGDEWYNPTTNKLYKLVANSGVTVQWAEVGAGATSSSGGASTTTAVTEGTNLYFTNARVAAAVSGLTTNIVTTANIVANSLLLVGTGNTFFGANNAVISSDTDLILNATGNVIINSGARTQFGAASANNAILAADGNITLNAGNTSAVIIGNTALRFKSFSASSNVLTPYPGDTFYNTSSNVLNYYNGNIWADVGYRTIPIATVNSYTFANVDAGKLIFHSMNATATVWTIPAGMPVGTTFTLLNDNAAGTVTIYAPFDTLAKAANSTTGNVSLLANGFATLYKVTNNKWFITGVGYI
jgi:hypothetical protein